MSSMAPNYSQVSDVMEGREWVNTCRLLESMNLVASKTDGATFKSKRDFSRNDLTAVCSAFSSKVVTLESQMEA